MSDYPREDASWLNHWCSTVLQTLTAQSDHRGTQLELSFRAGPSRSILASPLNGLLSSFELAGARRVAT
ncbi:hypothetical protein FPOA_26326 [Fusarium poae]|uniref:Uncharacterized protein n=1 Tax=Fusarium poae TaxID=36050 RepID=A0A1B8AAN4_FUSPO|nr:hypothetical protein FPOA_28693 [Fusarium poae]OBS15748.1 hypothetical protein FPOA_28139 [Fusarium poae]OBS17514.1 hypothetical protein FPOA_26326 [Fusarium poae]